MKRLILVSALLVGMGTVPALAQGRHLGERFVVPHNPGHERVAPRPPPRRPPVYVAPRRDFDDDDVYVRRRPRGPRIELDFD